MTTIKDIAELAGVSVGTVDRALNNRGRISPEAKKRIESIAAKLNYRKNKVAKSLANRKLNLKIAVVLHIHSNEFFGEVLRGIERARTEIVDFGISMELYRCKEFDPQDQLHLIDTAIAEGANAVVIVPINHPEIIKRLHRLNEEHIPFVLLASVLEDVKFFSAVRCDYARSGWMAGGLLRLISGGGCKALAFFPSFSMLGHKQRLESFRLYLEKHCPGITLENVVELPNDGFDSYQIVREELSSHPHVSHIVYNGVYSEAGIKAIENSGRRIQSIFFDFAPPTKQALIEGKISAAILQQPEEQGYRAIMVLFDYFTANVIPPEQTIVESYILFKESIEALPK
ncbi:MAG: substrate-binding domain-containing protein [Treponema sp.]|nr:substrate-binding domain-containing protein [Treponema sp.]